MFGASLRQTHTLQRMGFAYECTVDDRARIISGRRTLRAKTKPSSPDDTLSSLATFTVFTTLLKHTARGNNPDVEECCLWSRAPNSRARNVYGTLNGISLKSVNLSPLNKHRHDDVYIILGVDRFKDPRTRGCGCL